MNDKIKHFIACATIVTVGLCVAAATKPKLFWIALVAGVVAAIGKELYDKFIKKTSFSSGDIIADFFGYVTGAIIGTLISAAFMAL